MSSPESKRRKLHQSEELHDEDDAGILESYHRVVQIGDLSLVVTEMMKTDYGMYTWPSALVLAKHLWIERHSLFKATGLSSGSPCILELGAGTALPSMVAAKCGARVIVSDLMGSDALRNCKQAFVRNDIASATILGISWGEITPELCDMPPIDLIIGADVFYDPNGLISPRTPIGLVSRIARWDCSSLLYFILYYSV